MIHHLSFHLVPITGWTELEAVWIEMFPNTFTHNQQWESNPRPFYFESSALSARPHAYE